MSLIMISAGFAQQEVKETEVGHRKQKAQHHKQDPITKLESLSEDQKAQLKKMKMENREKAKPQREELKAVKTELRTKQTAENPNKEEIDQLIDKKHTMQAKMEKDRSAQRVKMRSVLTPEQRAELDASQKAKHEKRQAERKEMKVRKENH